MSTDKLGATGGFPDDKLGSEDEGELRFAIGVRDDNVYVEFGKPVAWLAMPPAQAVAFAELLIAKARIVARKNGEVLTVSL